MDMAKDSKSEFRDTPCICDLAVGNSAAGKRSYQLEIPEILYPDRKILNRSIAVVANTEHLRLLRTERNLEERGPKTFRKMFCALSNRIPE